MPFIYNKLWDQVSSKGLSKTEFAKKVGFTSTTLAKLGKNQNVNMDVLDRICMKLGCGIEDIVEYSPVNGGLRIISLFAGIGGFENALENSSLDGTTVFVSEIDKHACKSYLSNYPDCNLHGDITKINTDDIPDHDFLVAGFPCQAFSIAGKRNGFNDTRGTLFFDIERILKAKQPKFILLENVKNLISHDNGNTIETILKSLNKLGYTIDFTVINSKEAGLPQSRERMYIVGILGHPSEDYEIDPRNKKVNHLKNVLNKAGYKGFNYFNGIKYRNKMMTLSDIVRQDVEDKYYFDNDKIDNFLKIKNFETEDEKANSIRKVLDLPKNVHNDNERQRRVYSINGISPTILARSDTTKILVEKNGKRMIRKITPEEALIAQGFDEKSVKNILSSGSSLTQLYKQAGNAVSPPVVVGILNGLNELIMGKSNGKV